MDVTPYHFETGFVCVMNVTIYHDGVIKWKHFPRYWPFCAGNSPVTGEFPTQRPVMQSFDIFFDLRLNKRLSKQSRVWWFETPWHPLWRQCDDISGVYEKNTYKKYDHSVRQLCSKTCLATVLIRSIFAREKLHERFSASAVFQRKIERINTVARHVLL